MKLIVIYKDGSVMELEIRKYEDKYNNDFFIMKQKIKNLIEGHLLVKRM